MNLLIVLICAVVALGITAAYYIGYNDAIEDAKATGRFPELEEP